MADVHSIAEDSPGKYGPMYKVNPAKAVRVLIKLVSLATVLGILNGAGAAKALGNSEDISAGSFAAINFYANIETVGVVVTGTNLPKSATLLYHQSGVAEWRTGHPLMRIDDGRLVGSLFGLSTATAYEVKVQDGASEISGLVSTQPEELGFTPSAILYVNDDAPPGGDGSPGSPYRTIQEGVNHAFPGTQVLVRDGVYREMVTFPSSGSPANWIQVKAEGSSAILDGSQSFSGSIWTPYEGRKNVWYTDIRMPTDYLARDQLRYYLFDTLSGLLDGRGHNQTAMNEGWYIAPYSSRLYVRSLDNPSNHTWQAAQFNGAFEADGRDWLWIEGFEVRFYSKEHGCGVCMRNASHIVIRKNRIHNLQKGIFIDWNGSDYQGNDTRLEGNEIYDPKAADWPWNAVKGTTMEGTAVTVRGHIGAIVRGNDIHDFFNGIYTGSSAALENPGIAFDVDIYNNNIHQISDDALEPEGACINNRFRNNRIDASFVGVSLAPITQGPTWVLRSLITNYTGRGIKWDRKSDGVVLVYHNTFWTNAISPSAMDLISSVSNAVMRNNLSGNNGYAISEVPTGSTGLDWNYNNWYTTRASGSPAFKWENINYNSIAGLCSAARLECNGHDSDPGMLNPAAGDFTLLPSSPNVDRGLFLPGINDNYSGSAPDLGAFELSDNAFPTVFSDARTDPNPTQAAQVTFLVTFSEDVTGVDTSAPFNDFALQSSVGIQGAAIQNVMPQSGRTYAVGVQTGSGSGTLRLDVLDDDSIADGAGNPLGGIGAGNGNFISGEVYTIEKSFPLVTSITRASPNPSSAEIILFTVTFSEEVVGVDASDFNLTSTGGINGASIVELAGVGSTYTVKINTGSGDGTLRLDAIDNDSLVNAASIPLGGAGSGNGSYTAGEVYIIDRNPPVLTSMTRLDANPTTANQVRYTASFSEEVSGVDAADFTLTTTGGISGASLISVNVGASANTYIINAGTGSGNGTIRLDLLDDDSILDAGGQPLAGAGIGNGSFTSGEVYSKSAVNILSESYRSNGGTDGWILESNEDSSQGGSINTKAVTFSIGDDGGDRQYRTFISFPTYYLPDNAVIVSAILSIKKQGVVGSDPFSTHGNIAVDIKAGSFSYGFLRLKDFQALASLDNAGTIQNNPVDDFYWVLLDPAAYTHISRTGGTQFRLRFQMDDNDDRSADYLKYYSGDYSDRLAFRPRLQIDYYIP